MKHLKSLVLAVVAAALLLSVGASTASATVLTDSGGKLGVNRILDFSLRSGTPALLVNTAGEELDRCTTSTVKGKITNAGGAAATVTGEITELTWGGPCTFPTQTLVKGKLEIHHITGSTRGTVTSDAEIGVTINTVFFGSCVYGVTAGTDLGDLFGGNPAVFSANAVAEKLSGSAFACPATAKWTGTYDNTEPGGQLHVEAS